MVDDDSCNSDEFVGILSVVNVVYCRARDYLFRAFVFMES